MSQRLLRLEAVRALTGLSRSGIYSAQAAGNFPAAIRIGNRSVAWIESEITEWIAARIGAHRKAKQGIGEVSA